MIPAKEIDGELWIKASDHHRAIAELESQEPLGFMNAGQVLEMQQGECPYGYVYPKQKAGASVAIYTHPPQRTKIVFPTMLRKMWSGSEVQAWLDENVNKEQA